jgi:hypothetical protein
MEERSKRTTSIHNAWREQDAALVEAREFVELTATLTPCTPSQYMRAQTWVKIYDATHRAPKETP